MKIKTGEGRIISTEEFFRKNEEFHKNRARLPFEEKIEILVKLQKIAASARPDRKKFVWRI